MTTTDRGRGPLPASVCEITPTECEARTRVWRDGKLALEGFPVADISDHLEDESTLIWLDLLEPSPADLAVISEEFGLHPLSVEDALHERQRPKVDRYEDHIFVNMYDAVLDEGTGQLATREIAAFVTSRALITVRKSEGFDVADLLRRWDSVPDLVPSGVAYLLYGLLDKVVDSYFASVQVLDDAIESIEERLFDDIPRDKEVQRRSFEMRKSLVVLRRIVLPMREVVNAFMRRDLHVLTPEITPYYQDVYDHVLRATEWTESLRDLVSTILETSLTIQGNRLNIIMKKLTSWAAIIAVPTAVTGFYGQNLPYPGFATHWGVVTSFALMIGIGTALYVSFKRNDWL